VEEALDHGNRGGHGDQLLRLRGNFLINDPVAGHSPRDRFLSKTFYNSVAFPEARLT
jgi:hypothetical protein